jgi:hypothetical protein
MFGKIAKLLYFDTKKVNNAKWSNYEHENEIVRFCSGSDSFCHGTRSGSRSGSCSTRAGNSRRSGSGSC